MIRSGPGQVVGITGGEVEVDAGVGRLRVACPERHASAGRPPFAGSVFVEVMGRDVHLLPDTDPRDRP